MDKPARDQGGLDRAAGHQPEAVDHLLRPRQLELRDVFRRHRAVAHLCEVFGGVNQRELVPARGLGLDDIGGLDHARLDETGVDALVFVGGKNVRPDIDPIPG